MRLALVRIEGLLQASRHGFGDWLFRPRSPCIFTKPPSPYSLRSLRSCALLLLNSFTRTDREGALRLAGTHLAGIRVQQGVFPHLIFLARSSMPRKDTMDLRDIIAQLHAERARLDQAIAALEGSTPRRGRPPKAVTGGKRRAMSAAARKRISAAMKARWAVRKRRGSSAKLAKATAKKPSHRPQMSPAAKKKLSALMKARWAARKKQAKAA